MFNPQPRVSSVPLHGGHHCWVVDDALADPRAWAAWAQQHRAALAPAVASYPGLEMWLPEEPVALISEFFLQHLRARLGLRRVLEAAARMSLVTTPPHALLPRQRLCHRDNRGVPPDECRVAAVIYLFDDPALGGTSFYRPRQSPEATEALVDDTLAMDGPTFERHHPEVAPGYMLQGNPWFEQVARVPARHNRAIFYDGGLFHSGDIFHPERMSADPAVGRLTLNAFLRCRRNAT